MSSQLILLLPFLCCWILPSPSSCKSCLPWHHAIMVLLRPLGPFSLKYCVIALHCSLERSCFSSLVFPRFPFPLIPMDSLLPMTNTCCSFRTKAWERETLECCWWDYKLVQALHKTVWRLLKKLKIVLSCDPAVPLWSIYLKEMKAGSQRDICTIMFIVGLFKTAKSWK